MKGYPISSTCNKNCRIVDEDGDSRMTQSNTIRQQRRVLTEVGL